MNILNGILEILAIVLVLSFTTLLIVGCIVVIVQLIRILKDK